MRELILIKQCPFSLKRVHVSMQIHCSYNILRYSQTYLVPGSHI